MSFKSYKEESKKNWGCDQTGNLNIEQIQLGCLLRIADASEAMAKRFNDLIRENEWLIQSRNSLSQEVELLRNQNRGLKAAITRMKNKRKKDG